MTNLTKQEFIQAIEGMGFKMDTYYVKKGVLLTIDISKNWRVVVEKRFHLKLETNSNDKYDKALKLIKMILEGEL